METFGWVLERRTAPRKDDAEVRVSCEFRSGAGDEWQGLDPKDHMWKLRSIGRGLKGANEKQNAGNP
jgi:hypothetical protein